MPLKEKIKKYIQSNYGKFSISHVAHEYGCPVSEVEDYVLEELEPKYHPKRKRSPSGRAGKQP